MSTPPSANTPRGVKWPFLASLSGYTRNDLRGDLTAALTVAAVAIPEQMATARLGGFAPEFGFFAFIAGATAFALFGANRVLSVGADSTITPIFAGALMVSAAGGGYPSLAAALALLVGVILVVGGCLRLGWIADLVSVPVSLGFLAGIAVHIIVSQLPPLLGIADPSGHLLHRVASIAAGLDRTNLPAAGLGLSAFAITVSAEAIGPRWPGALVALAGTTVAVLVWGLERDGVAVLGSVPAALPHLHLPLVSLDALVQVFPMALVITMVVMLQSGATTRLFATGTDPAVARDFVGVGVANMLAGLIGAFPVNASPPRTAIVAASGARTQIAGLLAALLVLALLAFGTRLLAHLPTAALAGILLFIALRILRFGTMVEVCRQSREEFALILITMIAIVLLPIESGVGIGIVVSLLHGTWTTTRADPIEFERVPGTSIWWAASAKMKGETVPTTSVIAFQAPLSFLNANRFKQGMLALIDRHPRPLTLIVLEASTIVAIDYTGALILGEVIRQCHARGAIFAVARLESLRAQKAFDQFGLTHLLGKDRFFHSVDEAIRSLAQSATR